MCPIPCPSSLVACDSIRPSTPSSPIGIVADSCIAFSSSVICCSTASARWRGDPSVTAHGVFVLTPYPPREYVGQQLLVTAASVSLRPVIR